MTANSPIHELILFHRKRAGLSRNALADLAGVGKTVIYDIEHGKQTVRWSTLLAIFNALNISCEFTSPIMQDYEQTIRKNT